MIEIISVKENKKADQIFDQPFSRINNKEEIAIQFPIKQFS
jgi:hypothetical protein